MPIDSEASDLSTSSLQHLLHCDSIRRRLNTYCRYLDEYNIDAVASCFCEDAVTDYGAGRGGRVVGRANIAARIARGQAQFRRTHHQSGQVIIDVRQGSASAISYMTTWHELADGKIDVLCLRYLDELKLIDGDWLIAERRVEASLVDGFEGVEWNWVKRRVPE